MARTTLNLPENLLKQAKWEALERGETLGEVVTDALRNRYAKIKQARGKYLLYDKGLNVKVKLTRENIYDEVR